MAGAFGLLACVLLFVMWYATDDIEHLWTLGGIWACCHIAITLVSLFSRQ